MPLDWSPFVNLIRSRQRFVLTTHVRPDGDGLGSILALADCLRRQGKDVRLTVASSLPPRYDFLDPHRYVRQFANADEYRDAEALLVLDTGTWNQLGDFGAFMKTMHVPRAVIDHHMTQDDLSALRFVDTTAEATGRLVFEAIEALGGPLSPEAAHLLLVAVAMDTGWFHHPNTTPATFELAAKMMRAGARPTEAHECLFEQNTVAGLRLRGVVLERIQLTQNNRVAFTSILRGDYAATGAIPQDSEDLINYIRSVAGVEVGLLFMEQPAGGVKVSFRARRADVAKVAEKFGGGGHRLASGATLPDPLEDARSRVLAAVAEALASLP
jgi:phosphoesterase RecJ-like protein